MNTETPQFKATWQESGELRKIIFLHAKDIDKCLEKNEHMADYPSLRAKMDESRKIFDSMFRGIHTGMGAFSDEFMEVSRRHQIRALLQESHQKEKEDKINFLWSVINQVHLHEKHEEEQLQYLGNTGLDEDSRSNVLQVMCDTHLRARALSHASYVTQRFDAAQRIWLSGQIRVGCCSESPEEIANNYFGGDKVIPLFRGILVRTEHMELKIPEYRVAGGKLRSASY